MPLIAWSDIYAVNIHEVDDQHQKLISIMNSLFDAMQLGEGQAVVRAVLKELIDYTAYHFRMEEGLFRKYGYPELAAHKKEHEALAAAVEKFLVEFESGNKYITIDLLNFLSEWLFNHIQEVDKRYVAFLHSKGVQ